jgi:hypothetical protein
MKPLYLILFLSILAGCNGSDNAGDSNSNELDIERQEEYDRDSEMKELPLNRDDHI